MPLSAVSLRSKSRSRLQTDSSGVDTDKYDTTSNAMPLQTRFHKFDPERPPDVIGVYELAWADNAIIYIGSGVIRNRICTHARDTSKFFHSYRCLVTHDRRRARQIERREQRKFRDRKDRLPKYNHQVG